MIDKILHSKESNNNVYYLADYPEYSIQEWAKSISFFAGKRKSIFSSTNFNFEYC